MPFEEIVPAPIVAKNAVAGTDRVSVAIRMFSRGAAFPYFNFCIGDKLLSRLGWAEDQRIGVMIGTGRDRGKIRLSPSPSGFRLKPAKNRLSVSLFVRAGLGGEPYVRAGRQPPVIVTRETMRPASGVVADLYLTLPRDMLAPELKLGAVA